MRVWRYFNTPTGMIVGAIYTNEDHYVILADAMLVYQRENSNDADRDFMKQLGLPAEDIVEVINDYIPINICQPHNTITLHRNQIIFEFNANNPEELDEIANTYFQKIPARPAGSREQTGREGQRPPTDQTN